MTYGPGLHMLRADTSPVKERIAPMSLANPNLAFIACGNTQANQAKAEGKPVTLISEAKVMPSGGKYALDIDDGLSHSGLDRPALSCREVRHG